MHATTNLDLASGYVVGGGSASLPEAVAKYLDFLTPNDRLLLELAAAGSYSRRRIGKMLDLEPGTVSRRLRRVYRRLNDPLVARLLDPRCPLPPDYRQIGVEHFLTGVGTLDLAAQHDLAAAQVRRVLNYLRGWSRGMGTHGGVKERL